MTSIGIPILACPSKNAGDLYIKNYSTNAVIDKNAFKDPLVVIEISFDCKMCAVASKKGTLVRVFSTGDMKLLQELRRGKDDAEIYCIAFSHDCSLLSCTSSTGTIHLFSIDVANKSSVALQENVPSPLSPIQDEEDKKTTPKNRVSRFRFIQSIVPYFKSEWDFAKLKLPGQKSIVGFSTTNNNCIIAVTDTGNYYLAEFDRVNGGACKVLEEKKISEL